MKRRRNVALALVFAGAFLAVGLPYWSIPLSRLSLPRDVWGPGLVAGAALAVAACAFAGTRARAAGLAVALAVPAAVLARVLVEATRDPATHNLWPFELVLAAGPGLLAGGAGALAGALVARLRSR